MGRKPRFKDYMELLDLVEHQAQLIKQQSSTISRLTIKVLEQESVITELLQEEEGQA